MSYYFKVHVKFKGYDDWIKGYATTDRRGKHFSKEQTYEHAIMNAKVKFRAIHHMDTGTNLEIDQIYHDEQYTYHKKSQYYRTKTYNQDIEIVEHNEIKVYIKGEDYDALSEWYQRTQHKKTTSAKVMLRALLKSSKKG